MHKAKILTIEEVKAIREAEGGRNKVAKAFGVGQERIKGIKEASSLEEAMKYTGDQHQAGTVAPPKAPGKTVEQIGGAHTLALFPREFRMSSTLVWQAREAAVREWAWPVDITPEDFLDTYLWQSFRQRGIVLGAYQVLKGDENGSS